MVFNAAWALYRTLGRLFRNRSKNAKAPSASMGRRQKDGTTARRASHCSPCSYWHPSRKLSGSAATVIQVCSRRRCRTILTNRTISTAWNMKHRNCAFISCTPVLLGEWTFDDRRSSCVSLVSRDINILKLYERANRQQSTTYCVITDCPPIDTYSLER